MKFSRLERETICRSSEFEDDWVVYSASIPMIKRLSKISCPSKVFEDNDGVYAAEFRLPKNWIKFKKPRVLTEAQTAAQRERLESARRKRELIRQQKQGGEETC